MTMVKLGSATSYSVLLLSLPFIRNHIGKGEVEVRVEPSVEHVPIV